MKYYIVAITDDSCALSYTTSVLTKASSFDELNFNIDKICSEWYSEDEPVQVDEDGCYQQANGVYTSCSGYKELTKSTYNELKGFLSC